MEGEQFIIIYFFENNILTVSPEKKPMIEHILMPIFYTASHQYYKYRYKCNRKGPPSRLGAFNRKHIFSTDGTCIFPLLALDRT